MMIHSAYQNLKIKNKKKKNKSKFDAEWIHGVVLKFYTIQQNVNSDSIQPTTNTNKKKEIIHKVQ